MTSNGKREWLRKFLGVDRIQQSVRPWLRPVGVLAASLFFSAALAYGVGALATAIYGKQAFHSAMMFSMGGTQALAVALILVLSGDDFELNRLMPGKARWWSIPAGIFISLGLFVLEWVFLDPGEVSLGELIGRLAVKDLNVGLLAALSALTFAVGGFAEELVFRGLVQTSAERYYRPTSAIVLTSLLFAAPHLNFGWVAFLELFIIGMALSWYRRVMGSLVLPVTLHAFHNLLHGIAVVLTS